MLESLSVTGGKLMVIYKQIWFPPPIKLTVTLQLKCLLIGEISTINLHLENQLTFDWITLVVSFIQEPAIHVHAILNLDMSLSM